MTTKEAQPDERAQLVNADLTANRIEMVAALAAFLWIPLAIVLTAEWGWSLIALSVIALTAQAVRQDFGLPLQPSWVFASSALAVGGLAALAAPGLSLIPMMALAVGGGLVAAGSVWQHSSRRP